jgi:hypothetical protein
MRGASQSWGILEILEILKLIWMALDTASNLIAHPHTAHTLKDDPSPGDPEGSVLGARFKVARTGVLRSEAERCMLQPPRVCTSNLEKNDTSPGDFWKFGR